MDSTERRLRSHIRDIFSTPDRELSESAAREVENEVLALMHSYTHAPLKQKDAIYSAGERRILNTLSGKREPTWAGVVVEAPKPIPEGYHSITPYLIIQGAAKALEFYKKAFDAQELFRVEREGKIGHAEIEIGDSRIMLADEHPEMGFLSPTTLGGTPVSLLLYVKDVDTVFNQALVAGGEQQMPVRDQFYGDRSGILKDPFGHIWCLATHVEDVSPQELDERIESANVRSASSEA